MIHIIRVENNYMIKAILFDIDGTLLDSKKANRKFYQNFLKKSGYGKFSDDEVDKSFHLTLHDAISFLTKEPDEKVNEIWHFALNNYKSLYPVKLLDFPEREKEIIMGLKQIYKLAIVTGRAKVGLKTFFKASGLKNYFCETVTYEDYTHPKPDPEPLLIALKKLNLKSQEAIYIGDSEVDLRASQAINMKFICFYAFSKKIFKEADANVKSFKELEEAILALT